MSEKKIAPLWALWSAVSFAAVILALTFGPLFLGACSHNSLCFEYAKGIPAAFVALAIGGVASYIAWRQYLAAHAKLKLDLFEKRYAIFESTWRFLSDTAMHGAGQDPFAPITNIIPQAHFLFGEEVESFLSRATERRTQLWAIEARTRANGNVMRPEDIIPNEALMTWFHDQATTETRRVFAPYLYLADWR